MHIRTTPEKKSSRKMCTMMAPPYHSRTTTAMITGDVVQKFGQYKYIFHEVFPVDGHVICLHGLRLYEIDLESKKITLLAEIPGKSSSSFSGYHSVIRGNMGAVFHYVFNRYPLILEDKIIIPAGPGVCLSRADYKIVWNLMDKTKDPDLDTYTAAGDESTAFLIAGKRGFSYILAVDPSTGELKWMSEDLPLARWLVLGNDTVFCGGEKLWAFSRDGLNLWEFTPEDKIITNIVLGPDGVYFADCAKNLYKIDLGGNFIWKTTWEGNQYFQSHLIGAGNILYCVENLGESALETSESQVTAYRMEDGSKLWSLSLGSPGWVRRVPTVAQGILVIGTMDGDLIALASDPELYMQQGDAYLSKGTTEKAINSYETAAELYEKRGDTSRSQEILNLIQELENQPPVSATPEPTTPPESTFATPEPTAVPESPPPQSSWILISAGVISAGILVGILIACYLFKRKKS